MFELRAGVASDVASMYRLDLLCFAKPFRFSLLTMRRLARHPGVLTVVAESEGRLLGFVMVELGSPGIVVTAAYIATLDVDPSIRRMGIAAALMSRAEATAEGRNAVAMELHVSVANPGAVAFYARMGYVEISRISGFYGVGLDAWVYRKLLKPA
jgi:ribosomal-protein-alanine N-acetyltransferase